MKSLREKALSLGATEILDRDQLKAVHGGEVSKQLDNVPSGCRVLCFDIGVQVVGGSGVMDCDAEITEVVCSQYSSAYDGVCVCS